MLFFIQLHLKSFHTTSIEIQQIGGLEFKQKFTQFFLKSDSIPE